MSFAQVTLLGRLGQDPEAKEFGEHKAAKFSIATNSRKKGESHTTWHNVTAWGKLGQFAYERLNKGSQVLVVGELTSDKKDDKTYWNVNANTIRFADTKADNTNQTVAQTEGVPNMAPTMDENEEMPI